MAYDYDKLYSSERNALGEPTDKFVKFFETYRPKSARVLDVGCGQGRDALFIARLGHRVVGVDVSPSGIAGLAADSEREHLGIVATVADITEFEPEGLFDIILIDRTLHMLDADNRQLVLTRLIQHIAQSGRLLIADEKINMSGFKAVLDACGRDWRIIDEKGGFLFVAFDE